MPSRKRSDASGRKYYDVNGEEHEYPVSPFIDPRTGEFVDAFDFEPTIRSGTKGWISPDGEAHTWSAASTSFLMAAENDHHGHGAYAIIYAGIGFDDLPESARSDFYDHAGVGLRDELLSKGWCLLDISPYGETALFAGFSTMDQVDTISNLLERSHTNCNTYIVEGSIEGEPVDGSFDSKEKLINHLYGEEIYEVEEEDWDEDGDWHEGGERRLSALYDWTAPLKTEPDLHRRPTEEDVQKFVFLRDGSAVFWDHTACEEEFPGQSPEDPDFCPSHLQVSRYLGLDENDPLFYGIVEGSLVHVFADRDLTEGDLRLLREYFPYHYASWYNGEREEEVYLGPRASSAGEMKMAEVPDWEGNFDERQFIDWVYEELETNSITEEEAYEWGYENAFEDNPPHPGRDDFPDQKTYDEYLRGFVDGTKEILGDDPPDKASPENTDQPRDFETEQTLNDLIYRDRGWVLDEDANTFQWYKPDIPDDLEYDFSEDWFIYAWDPETGDQYYVNTESWPEWEYVTEDMFQDSENPTEDFILPFARKMWNQLDWEKVPSDEELEEEINQREIDDLEDLWKNSGRKKAGGFPGEYLNRYDGERKEAAVRGPLPDLSYIETLGGSTGADLMEGPEGELYVMKRGADPGHIVEEGYADDVYRVLGLAVPDSAIYLDEYGDPVKLAEYIDGVTLQELLYNDDPRADYVIEELKKGFAVDALLGNWDVVGLDFDNVILGDDGVVYRVDNGGALRRRARGAEKPGRAFSGRVGEIHNMRSPGKNYSAARVFGDTTEDEIAEQILEFIVPNRERILSVLPPELREVMSERIDYMERWASGDKEASVKGIPAPSGESPLRDGKACRFVFYGKGIRYVDSDHLEAAEKLGVRADPEGGFGVYFGRSGVAEIVLNADRVPSWLMGRLLSDFPGMREARLMSIDASLNESYTREDILRKTSQGRFSVGERVIINGPSHDEIRLVEPSYEPSLERAIERTPHPFHGEEGTVVEVFRDGEETSYGIELDGYPMRVVLEVPQERLLPRPDHASVMETNRLEDLWKRSKVASIPKDILERDDLYWRVHWRDSPPFSPENADSIGWGLRDLPHIECPECGGSGRVPFSVQSGGQVREYTRECEYCGGRGWVYDESGLPERTWRRGYSAFENVEDLYNYGFRQIDEDEPVVAFTGKETGERPVDGDRGEVLVIPDMREVYWFTWKDLEDLGWDSHGGLFSLASSQNPSGVIYRGVAIKLPEEITRLMFPENEEDYELSDTAGERILDLISQNERRYDSPWHEETYGPLSLGRHWTTRRSLAETAARVSSVSGGGSEVVIEAAYDDSGVDPDLTGTTREWAKSEDEVTLLPGARLEVRALYVKENPNSDWIEYRFDPPIEKSALLSDSEMRGEGYMYRKRAGEENTDSHRRVAQLFLDFIRGGSSYDPDLGEDIDEGSYQMDPNAPEWMRDLSRDLQRRLSSDPNAPEGVQEIIESLLEAGGFSDQYTYKFLVDSLQAISEGASPEDAPEYLDSYIPVHSHELLDWFSSNAARNDIISEMAEEYGIDSLWDPGQGVYGLLMAGAAHELEQVFHQVWEAVDRAVEEYGDPFSGLEDLGKESGRNGGLRKFPGEGGRQNGNSEQATGRGGSAKGVKLAQEDRPYEYITDWGTENTAYPQGNGVHPEHENLLHAIKHLDNAVSRLETAAYYRDDNEDIYNFVDDAQTMAGEIYAVCYYVDEPVPLELGRHSGQFWVTPEPEKRNENTLFEQWSSTLRDLFYYASEDLRGVITNLSVANQRWASPKLNPYPEIGQLIERWEPVLEGWRDYFSKQYQDQPSNTLGEGIEPGIDPLEELWKNSRRKRAIDEREFSEMWGGDVPKIPDVGDLVKVKDFSGDDAGSPYLKSYEGELPPGTVGVVLEKGKNDYGDIVIGIVTEDDIEKKKVHPLGAIDEISPSNRWNLPIYTLSPLDVEVIAKSGEYDVNQTFGLVRIEDVDFDTIKQFDQMWTSGPDMPFRIGDIVQVIDGPYEGMVGHIVRYITDPEERENEGGEWLVEFREDENEDLEPSGTGITLDVLPTEFLVLFGETKDPLEDLWKNSGKVTVTLPEDLHARTASAIAGTAREFLSDVRINGVSARGPLGLLSLGIREGDAVTVTCRGKDAPEALKAMRDLLSSRSSLAARIDEEGRLVFDEGEEDWFSEGGVFFAGDVVYVDPERDLAEVVGVHPEIPNLYRVRFPNGYENYYPYHELAPAGGDVGGLERAWKRSVRTPKD